MSGNATDFFLPGGTVKGSSTSRGVLLLAVEISQSDDGTTEEGDSGAPVFGGGFGTAGGRPMPPDANGAAEVVCLRSPDGLPVLGVRDLRAEKAADIEAEGTVRLAGYDGAKVTVEKLDATHSASFIRGGDLRVPGSAIVQGDPAAAKDVALADPLVTLVQQLNTFLLAVSSTTGVPMAGLTAAILPFLTPPVGPTPAAPTTRAPNVRGAPGA